MLFLSSKTIGAPQMLVLDGENSSHSGNLHDIKYQPCNTMTTPQAQSRQQLFSVSEQSIPFHKFQFPFKLRQLLDDVEKNGNESIVSWLAHGKSFKVHNPKQFEAKIMKKYFRQTQFKSFTRQLYHYGFGKVDCGNDRGAFFHPQFRRDDPSLCLSIQRKNKKESSSPYCPPPLREIICHNAGGGDVAQMKCCSTMDGRGGTTSSIDNSATIQRWSATDKTISETQEVLSSTGGSRGCINNNDDHKNSSNFISGAKLVSNGIPSSSLLFLGDKPLYFNPLKRQSNHNTKQHTSVHKDNDDSWMRKIASSGNKTTITPKVEARGEHRRDDWFSSVENYFSSANCATFDGSHSFVPSYENQELHYISYVTEHNEENEDCGTFDFEPRPIEAMCANNGDSNVIDRKIIAI